MTSQRILVEHDGCGVIVDPVSGRLFTLNETGLFVWRLLESGTGQAEIVRKMSEEFEVEPAEAEADLRIFLAQAGVGGEQ